MYPSSSGSGQNPQQQQQQQQGQPPVKWETDPNYRGPPPQNAIQYPSPYLHRPDQQTIPGQQIPRSDRPQMASVHPQQQLQQQQQQQQQQQHSQHQHYQPIDPYRSLPPVAGNLYPTPLHDPYRPQPLGAQNLNQSTPRQRTAIACKYCRRRKIRCSGFEHSEDGRCSNCVRFSQECIFTPVSQQAQAFVPAQAVYGRGARGSAQAPVPLYGAYGQPWHPGSSTQAYPMQTPGGGYAVHPNQAYPPPPMYQQAPYEPPQNQQQPSRRRRTEEPHIATLPPPNPGPTSHLATLRDQDAQSYSYPDPTSFTNPTPHSPASSTTSYQSHQPQPYYAPQPVRRTSPSAIYPYEQTPEAGSPHTSVGYGYPQQGPGSLQGSFQAPATSQPAPRSEARTPPPPSAPGSDQGGTRSGLRISEMVSETGSGGERTAADSDMVSALNRRAQEPNRRS